MSSPSRQDVGIAGEKIGKIGRIGRWALPCPRPPGADHQRDLAWGGVPDGIGRETDLAEAEGEHIVPGKGLARRL